MQLNSPVKPSSARQESATNFLSTQLQFGHTQPPVVHSAFNSMMTDKGGADKPMDGSSK